jgi:AcrR family transcriptional regulator
MVTRMGPHGLPLSSFVAHDEREELMALFAATVYERGYAGTRLDEVADRAGVTLATVDRYWPTELDCLLDTVATFTRQLFGAAAVAFMSAEGDGPRALHAALTTVLHDAALAPEMTYMSVVELPRFGPPAHERQARMIELFGELLSAGFAAMDELPPNPDILSLCIGGSIWETLRRHAAERRLHELPDALPAISYVCISTFYGLAQAQRVSSMMV